MGTNDQRARRNPALNHHLRRRAGVMLVALSGAAVMLTACGSSGGSDADASSGPTITIAYGAPTADQTVPSLADEAGLFAKYGINVKVEYLDSAQLLPALVGGQVQLAQLPAPGYETIALNGTDLQAVGRVEDSFDVELVAGPEIQDMKSLDGKSIAISKPGSFSDLMARVAEQKYGITLNEVPLGSLPNQVSAFQAGQVDSVSDLSPSQLSSVQSARAGSHVLVDWRTDRDMPGMMLVGKTSWLQANKDVAENALRAINEGVSYFKGHEDEAEKVIAEVTGADAAASKASYGDVLKSLAPTIVPTVTSEKTVLGYISDDYPSAKTFDASKLVDPSYAQAAVSGGASGSAAP